MANECAHEYGRQGMYQRADFVNLDECDKEHINYRTLGQEMFYGSTCKTSPVF